MDGIIDLNMANIFFTVLNITLWVFIICVIVKIIKKYIHK